ncbi:MAG: DUF1311 domain-containing protein [Euryhalocaulis sp.]|uniref:lysozyme inhibitor LprI family protein n=1 Tax=Euryhalocaulis sp. TaxID=2744307 RepID=UPI001820A3A5|nr:lysozyme inhibitor LprI family protein [Euryhalocaulis sp.]MBA4800778.1 DUF1311 domain-containing protein [Euryhalocaulis sp.]
MIEILALVLLIGGESQSGYDTLKTPSGADRTALADCLSAAREEGDAWQSCAGVVSDPCMDKPEGYTTVGMVACQARETALWDGYLNAWYRDARAALPGKTADDLRDVQRYWIEYRDAKCALPYAVFEGGTMAQPVAAGCMLEETASRALDLAGIVEMAGGDVEF